MTRNRFEEVTPEEVRFAIMAGIAIVNGKHNIPADLTALMLYYVQNEFTESDYHLFFMALEKFKKDHKTINNI